jgi:hypothetical protein
MVGARAISRPATAVAYAAVGSAPEPGSPGLPDGRVYQQVSPQTKGGYEAGGPYFRLTPPVMLAAQDGNGVLFNTSGPVGWSATGQQAWGVSKHTGSEWKTEGLMPRAIGEQSFRTTIPITLGASSDLSRIIFAPRDEAGQFPQYTPVSTLFAKPGFSLFPPSPGEGGPAIFSHEDGSGPSSWLGQPTATSPVGDANLSRSSQAFTGGIIAGASTDLQTVYFNYWGTLTPRDEAVNPGLGNLSRTEIVSRGEGDDPGFYEWRDGKVSYAGVLPNGSIDPYGAISAGSFDDSYTGESLQNQVSEDGSDAFFLSPAPESQSGRPSELYVRETGPSGGQRTVLVSRDTLLPDIAGLPTPAPNGPVDVKSSLTPGTGRGDGDEGAMYASPDGSRVFFVSRDQLVGSAPADQAGKLYEFNLNSETLNYIPEATPPTLEPETASAGQVLASTPDGSTVLFEKLAGGPAHGERHPVELDIVSGGRIVPVAPLTQPVEIARATPDGSIFVFQTTDAIPGFNDGGTHLFNGNTIEPNAEIFRYEVASETLTCLSCPGPGIVPSSSAELDHSWAGIGINEENALAFHNHGITTDGDRVFFDTAEALVPQDTNGVRDVYEWENGKLYLISSGISSEPSYFGDNSPDGDDVFFGTAQGLAPGDTDGAYDVYDARVPRPGDATPPLATPCEGESCQGPPALPPQAASPASATFSGSETAPAAMVVASPAKPAPTPAAQRAEKLKRALEACHKRLSRPKRRACEAQARKRYGSRGASSANKPTPKGRP